jgi:hypothetical protein
MAPRGWKFWRQKSRKGSLYKSDSRRGSLYNSTRSLFKSKHRDAGSHADEQISSLSTEEAVVQILRIQQRLKQEKKKTQDKQLQRQMQIDNLKMRKRKAEYDLKLKHSSTPWNNAEYRATLRHAFKKESFPSSKKYLDEAMKVLKEEHRALLLERLAKLFSTQNNEELMLVMGSGPNLKDEMGRREKKIRNLISQVEAGNRQLGNVLHYKEYILTKMKDKIEIELTTKHSLNRAISDLQSIDGSLEEDEITSNEEEEEKYAHQKTDDEERSLDDDELFLPQPQDPLPDKPLLAAAKKALQQQQQQTQTKIQQEQDEMSL